MKKRNLKAGKRIFLYSKNLVDLVRSKKVINSSTISKISIKKSLVSYNILVCYYFDTKFLVFFRKNEFFFPNFSLFVKNYKGKNAESWGSLSLFSKQSIFDNNVSEFLLDTWVIDGFDETINFPVLQKIRKLKEDLQVVDEGLYDLHLALFAHDQNKIDSCINSLVSKLNETILFFVEIYYFRSTLIENIFSFLHFSNLFLDYFKFLLIIDSHLDFWLLEFEDRVESYKRLYKKSLIKEEDD